MKNIKGIILDVDGIIVGEKIGVNSPDPSKKVIEKLKKSNVPISLCTAKPYFSILKIIKDANLNNFHITDGGSVIINPLNNRIIEKHIIDSKQAKDVTKMYIKNNVYVDVYTIDNYYISKAEVCDITKKHEHILQKSPIIVDDLVKKCSKLEITKIMPIARDDNDSLNVRNMFEKLNTTLTLNFGIHPVANPLRFGIITEKGISKAEGVRKIADNINTSLDNILAVGDSTSDWKFMELCGYVGTVENATDDLKELVKLKKEHYIGKSVDEDGIIDILDFFGDK